MNRPITLTVAAAMAAGALGAQPGAATRVVLVTGATSGLGREVAVRLAAGGAHVIVHGRDSARGREVVEEIARAGAGSARFVAADLSDNADIRRLAATVLRDYPRLDVLVNNAGIGSTPPERAVNAAGVESRLQVNYLAGVLLTRLLLPRLVASAPARIVNVSSLAASPIDFTDPMLTRQFSGGRAYGQSKLAQVMFTFDLAEALRGKGVTVNALHPATMMPTGMVLRGGFSPRSTIDEGARAVLHLVNEATETGQFYNGLQPGRAHAQAYDPAARRQLAALADSLLR